MNVKGWNSEPNLKFINSWSDRESMSRKKEKDRERKSWKSLAGC